MWRYLRREELVRRITNFDALIVRSATRVTKEVLEGAKKLRFIGRAGVVLDNIDLEAAKEKGIKVVNDPEAPSVAVAELVMSLMLA